jgi:hypothetical protein
MIGYSKNSCIHKVRADGDEGVRKEYGVFVPRRTISLLLPSPYREALLLALSIPIVIEKMIVVK